MTESLLSFSEVLLFGRILEDLLIGKTLSGITAKAAPPAEVASANMKGLAVDGINLNANDVILLWHQTDDKENGLYTITAAGGNPWERHETLLGKGALVTVTGGASQSGTYEQLANPNSGRQVFELFEDSATAGPKGRGRGNNKLLSQQINDAQFARIYGFSYEGTYYELPEPTVFMVHGNGMSATDGLPDGQGARAPQNPSVTGVASADYQISNDIRVWPYDKADFTIRLDVMTGMFEQVLLDIYFGFDSPAISGAKVSGAKVSGAKVSGAKVSGAKVSGAKVSGAKARGSGD